MTEGAEIGVVCVTYFKCVAVVYPEDVVAVVKIELGMVGQLSIYQKIARRVRLDVALCVNVSDPDIAPDRQFACRCQYSKP